MRQQRQVRRVMDTRRNSSFRSSTVPCGMQQGRVSMAWLCFAAAGLVMGVEHEQPQFVRKNSTFSTQARFGEDARTRLWLGSTARFW